MYAPASFLDCRISDVLQVTEHHLAQNARIVHPLALIASLRSQTR
jgi:hypothetical protein